VTLLDYVRSGDHSGDIWEITLTELEAEQTTTWYLQRYPHIPFEHPRVTITPDYVAGEGDAAIAGLRVLVGGKARITLAEGLPRIEILELSLPMPGPIRQAIVNEIRVQLRRADLLPRSLQFSRMARGGGNRARSHLLTREISDLGQQRGKKSGNPGSHFLAIVHNIYADNLSSH
jgi:hypothetical protein